MQLKTVLNRVQKFRSFVYGDVVWLDPDKNQALLVQIMARANSKPICSGCGCPGPGYDTLEPRMFEFVPLWNITVFFAYALRRVNCETCGVKVERVPWADGKSTLTKTYMQFLATWAKRLSLRFSRTFGKERSAQLLFICSDMWKPYLTVIAKKAGQAIHVLDRFHIAMHMNKAIDEVRAKETRELKAKGLAPILTHSRWCLLKRPENLTSKQEVKLIDLLRRPSLS